MKIELSEEQYQHLLALAQASLRGEGNSSHGYGTANIWVMRERPAEKVTFFTQLAYSQSNDDISRTNKAWFLGLGWRDQLEKGGQQYWRRWSNWLGVMGDPEAVGRGVIDELVAQANWAAEHYPDEHLFPVDDESKMKTPPANVEILTAKNQIPPPCKHS